MQKELVTAATHLQGELMIPGDKSISHRSVMFGAIAQGTSKISHFLFSDDCLHTISALQALGVKIQRTTDSVTIEGVGFNGFTPAKQAIDLGNSGTSTRLLMGLLSKQPFPITFSGDASLSKRPMQRVIAPLQKMGATITATDENYLPLTIRSNHKLTALDETIPVASAQVKSALMFAAMQADEPSHLTELAQTRDHTERMLRKFGGQVDITGLTLTVPPQPQLKAQSFRVPGDMSSAAFFILAAILVSNSEIRLKQVGLNGTRTGFLDVLSRMGADIRVENIDSDFEVSGDLIVSTSSLKATEVGGTEIPNVIDEIPLIALAATQAQGTTVIKDAAELRVKETDRIATVTAELRKLGAQIEEQPDGMVITGPTPLKAVTSDQLDSHGDHRIGLMLAVAALISQGHLTLNAAEAINVSYPAFFTDLTNLLN
ncbi:3-phosphoshikimate 1-carboxyvinyltransferase [Loigolactobacillus backii]|uniref:3-phosphoshikimate 1-carboxyvinyltransferase n=1 Tax=Loigolactobacillus backii TaxID=375175 RepID=A0A192GXW0_9LACO|nr:3-phosphoshikimate 1-carboxyvinyltransferase [Loigolactobacillus backii]ANK61354.1 3-phosphoshikimate 1-carboxyvinyltransferase [Loigolactobacillus backii]ANK69446.1 3-phosphoshikimate 1-carboxyvinyltransferase [Loigolactobacillus backii]MDA5387429.1 3-phosphoshikimate 1-carboxyvinyltransferase [Loigolactobacillus backii]MDA5389968.1 3-phosphoshikimate 1-carboxyvinyltransferase [Loigolactobacillus backii]